MPKEVLICSGTIMEGFDIDIVKYCGIKTLTVEQYDTLHDAVSDLELLTYCKHYHFNPHEDPDCLSPLELCQYILAKGVRKHGSKALF